MPTLGRISCRILPLQRYRDAIGSIEISVISTASEGNRSRRGCKSLRNRMIGLRDKAYCASSLSDIFQPIDDEDQLICKPIVGRFACLAHVFVCKSEMCRKNVCVLTVLLSPDFFLQPMRSYRMQRSSILTAALESQREVVGDEYSDKYKRVSWFFHSCTLCASGSRETINTTQCRVEQMFPHFLCINYAVNNRCCNACLILESTTLCRAYAAQPRQRTNAFRMRTADWRSRSLLLSSREHVQTGILSPMQANLFRFSG